MRKKHNLCTIKVWFHYERPLAILVSLDGDRRAAVWLPKGPVDYDGDLGHWMEITLPEDLAKEKGLI